jgi:hypothetical protein
VNASLEKIVFICLLVPLKFKQATIVAYTMTTVWGTAGAVGGKSMVSPLP